MGVEEGARVTVNPDMLEGRDAEDARVFENDAMENMVRLDEQGQRSHVQGGERVIPVGGLSDKLDEVRVSPVAGLSDRLDETRECTKLGEREERVSSHQSLPSQ